MRLHKPAQYHCDLHLPTTCTLGCSMYACAENVTALHTCMSHTRSVRSCEPDTKPRPGSTASALREQHTQQRTSMAVMWTGRAARQHRERPARTRRSAQAWR
eukprot:359709-Chlamydomonas_euryale.AAC.1